jgi:hypothetical protein
MTFVRMRLALDLRDFWVGLFWDIQPCHEQFVVREQKIGGSTVDRLVHPQHLHVYVCLVPFVALHFEFSLGLPPERNS